MIDQLINNSRASFKTAPHAFMYEYFDVLIKLACLVHPDINMPNLKICYSLNRLCETFKFRDKNYIIYDQYLGQSFNKMNRILFHEDDNESIAYLCKILSEEFYLVNNYEKAIAYNLYYRLTAKAKFEHFPKEFVDKKNEFISIQESFVLFHELAHSVVSNDINQLKNAEDFLNSYELGRDLITSTQEIFKISKQDPNKIKYFFEEVACDFLATNFTYVYFNNIQPVKHANIFEAISAGFLFLRTIYTLRNRANNFKNEDRTIFTHFMNIRYNALRTYFVNFPEELVDYGNLVEIYEFWEEKFEMNIFFLLNNEFEDNLLNTFKEEVKLNQSIIKEFMGL